MTPERWRKINEIFHQALELESERRSAFLDEVCAGDQELRSEVESLVTLNSEAHSFLATPIAEPISHLFTENQESDPLIGRTLGDFTIREKLGEGGFGEVYIAEQLTLAREAVIKVLHARHLGSKQMLERFMREAQLASRLEHPYTAHVYAFGAEPDGLLWIAMEYVHGTPLNKLLEVQGPLPLEKVVPLLDKICEVVETAHEYGIIHRDLKPANVMVISRAGQLLPKLLDFGIAKSLTQVKEDNRTTEETEEQRENNNLLCVSVSSVVQIETIGPAGSPYYMAPELWWQAAQADARTDIYALGVLTYELITGNPPFDGSTPSDLARAHTLQAVPQLNDSFPVALNGVLARAMAKLPEDRYGRATEFAAALRKAAGLEEQKIDLPHIDEILEESLITGAPQPLAEAVVSFKSARNLHQARDRMIEIFRVSVRYVGLLAIACSAQVGSKKISMAALISLHNLCRHSLSEGEWIELARELCKPFAQRRDAFPVPELVSLFFTQKEYPDLFESLLELQKEVASGTSSTEEQVRELVALFLPNLALLLRELQFLSDYRLVIPHQDYAECWMGLNRKQIAWSRNRKGMHESRPILTDADGRAVVSLWPLMQVAVPVPGNREEIFLFAGKGWRGAKLLSMPSGFELQDESTWDFFSKYFFEVEERSEASLFKGRVCYPGLSSFTEKDAESFFGREKETELFLNRMRIQPLLAVVGPSGTGKSSFVQAGVVAGLSEDWTAITVRPGSAPLANLMARLLKEGLEVGDLQAASAQNRDLLGETLREGARKIGRGIVLVIDQFEELFTLCSDEEERLLFSEAISRAARSAEEPVRVILTLRDDFLIRAEELIGLRNRLSQGLQLLTTPAREDLLRILTEPAQRAGYEFEDKELAKKIVDEVAGQAGALPLLAFTAAKLWEGRDRQFKQLRRKVYEAIGGVGGALAQHAEAIMAEMTKQEQRLVREAFRHLVTGEGTRAVLSRPELIQVLGGGGQAEAVIEKLIGARLLVVSEAEGRVERIEIVHETMLDTWPRLKNWRQEDAEGARLRDQVRQAARQWEERGRAKGLLWRDEAIKEYQLWRSRFPGKLTEAEEAFGEASLAEATRLQRLKRLFIGAFFVALIIGSSVLFWQREQAERRLLESYEEQGRQELLDGNSLRALVYFDEVYRKGNDNSPLRFLLARAMRPLDAQIASIEGHSVSVNCAAFSPDGGRIVTASDDRTAKVWDTSNGKLLATMEGHSDMVTTASFSPDGNRIVTSSQDGTAKVWDAANGKLLFSLEGHKIRVASAAFSPDGNRIVTSSSDGTVKVWEGITGRLLDTFEDIKNPIDLRLHSSAFSPDSRLIVTASDDRTAKVWDLSSHKIVLSIEGHKDFISSAAFSPDGSRIVTGSFDKTAKVWDARTGKMLASLEGHTAQVSSAGFSPDGKFIVTSSFDKTAKVWDAASGRIIGSLEGHRGFLFDAAFSPDGKRIVTASIDKTAKLWDVAALGLPVSLEGHKDFIDSVAFSSDGKRIVTASRDGSAKVWDATSRKLLTSLEDQSSYFRSAVFSPDGKLIVTASGDRTQDQGGHQTITESVKTAKVWDAANGKLLISLEGHKSWVNSATFSPDGSLIATASSDKTAKVWDVTTGKMLTSLEGHTDIVTSAAFSPDGNRIVTASFDNTAKIWDVSTGKPLITLEGHKYFLNSARFSPDGRLVVTSSTDSTAKVWDAKDGELLVSLEGHGHSVNTAAFSPDSRLIVTGSGDRTAKIWDAASGKLLTTLEGHQGELSSVTFSPDGNRIATASYDLTARVWNIHLETRSPAEITDIVRQRVPFRLEQGRLVSTY